jgi:hypothetical protein
MRNFAEQLHKISNFHTEKNRTREGKGGLFLNKGNEWRASILPSLWRAL